MPEINVLPAVASVTDSAIFLSEQGGITSRVTRAQIVLGVKNSLDAEIAITDVEIATLQSGKLAKAGDTMTGALTLSGAPTADLHATTRLYVNSADNLRLPLVGGTMTGIVNMGNNRITNTANPTSAQDVATQNYVITTAAKTLEAYNPVATSTFPVTYGGEAITSGDRFNITAAGVVGPVGATVTVEIGDVVEALVNVPGNIVASWAIYNANTIAASTTAAGVIQLATDAEAIAKTSTTRALTPSNFATGNYQASATREGLIELATAAEFTTGTDAIRAITPSVFNTAQTDYNYFCGIDKIVLTSAGTWTATASAVANDVFSRHTAAAETATISIDISMPLRTEASRGFRLDSYDVIYKIGTASLVTHVTALTTLNFTDNTAANPTSATPAITGTLITAFAANIRVTNVTIDVPSFLNTSAAKHMISVTPNMALTTVYDFYGINLRFSRSGN